MGARTDAARAEVLTARGELAGEVVRLEAAGRAAVDIPAKIRRAPARTAALAGGAVFLVAGGPGRLFRRAKRLVTGPGEPLPKSLLPDEIEKAVRKLGSDGSRVRGVLEREFADFVDERSKLRRERDLGATAALILGNVLKPVSSRAGRQLAERLFAPDGPGFAEAVDRIRERREAGPADKPLT